MARVKFYNKETGKWEYADSAYGSGGTVTDEQIASAVEDYMAEHPIEGGSGIHIGAEAPTDDSVNVWIDTDEEAETPSVPSGGSSAPSDWNANEGEPGHVLNRTHWVDKKETVLIPVDTYPLDSPNSVFNAFYDRGFNTPIVAGKTYIVNFDGNEYKCIGKLPNSEAVLDDFGSEIAYIGNVSAYYEDFSDNSTEPFFFIEWAPDEDAPDSELYILESYGAVDSIIFGVTEVEEIVHEIPNKYLPNYLPRADTRTVDTTFHGVVGDRETVFWSSDPEAYAVKITPNSLSADELIGATMVVNIAGENQTVPLTAEIVVDASGIAGVPSTAVLQGTDPVVFSTPTDATIGTKTLSAGTWFMYLPKNLHVVSLSCLPPYEEEVVHKLDKRFMQPYGINQEPFYIVDTYGEGTLTNGGYFFFAKNERINEQMRTGVIAIEFDFQPIGATTASRHSIVMTCSERRAFSMFASGRVLYMAEMVLDDNSLSMFEVSPLKSKDCGSAGQAYFIYPVTKGEDHKYYALTVDESGSVVAGLVS